MLNIITDSSSEISAEEAERLGVQVVPLTVVFGEKAYLEGVDLKKDEFYARLKKEFPHTSQPSVEQFTEAFVQTGGEDTLVLLISSALSGTVNAARLAKEQGGFTRVRIYETNCTTCMLKLLVEAAVKHREKPLNEVVAILDELRPRIRLLAALDTLEYLKRGGRIKKSVAFVGELLGIKPLVTVTPAGTVEMAGKAHGQRRAIAAIADFIKDADEEYPVYFLQTDDETPARSVMAATGRENAPLVRINCAVGTHIGGNAVGVAYVRKKI